MLATILKAAVKALGAKNTVKLATSKPVREVGKKIIKREIKKRQEPKYSFDEIILPQSVKDKILAVNYADIESTATATNSILFFDEADARWRHSKRHVKKLILSRNHLFLKLSNCRREFVKNLDKLIFVRTAAQRCKLPMRNSA